MTSETEEDILKRAKELFAKYFGKQGGVTQDIRVVKSPGRVNLIGEHVDYCNGYVLPFAIDFATYVVCKKNAINNVRIFSDSFCTEGKIAEFGLFHVEKVELQWLKYIQGVVVQFHDTLKLKSIEYGFDAVIISNLPIGAGLSSSASLEVAIAKSMLSLYAIPVEKLSDYDIVSKCVKAEREYAGMPCGIMDQSAVLFCQKTHFLLLDCRNQAHRQVPFSLYDEYDIVVCNSNAKHELVNGEFAKRVMQCRDGLNSLNKHLNKKYSSLRDVYDDRGFDNLIIMECIPDLIVRKRVKHILSEMDRVRQVVSCLEELNNKEHDKAQRSIVVAKIGRLMYESHESLRDDYDVSCKEIDLLIEISKDLEGIVGSRMTGGGFGGCTVSIVKKDASEQVMRKIEETYFAKSSRQCFIFRSSPAAGASIMQ